MKILPTLLTSTPYLALPQSIVGWASWILWLVIVVLLVRRWRMYNQALKGKQITLLILLILAVPVTSLFIGFRLPPGGALPPPDLALDPSGQVVMVFSAIPWVLAAGLLGALPAGGLALFSGLLLALWGNHNPFFPLELAILGLVLGAASQQRYRTPFYRAIRHPLVASLVGIALYGLLALVNIPFTAQGLLAVRVDYMLSNLAGNLLALAIIVVVAGGIAEIIAALFKQAWGTDGPLVPSPAEQSLQSRFLYGMAPLALVLLLVLIGGDWFVAGNAAQEMLQARMADAANMAAQYVPNFFETGQNLIGQFADDAELVTAPPTELTTILERDLRSVAFFRQLYVLSPDGQALAGFPANSYISTQAPLEEQVGLSLALTGFPIQTYTLPPTKDGTTAQVSFITTITDASGAVKRVLIGRTDLDSNPFTRPIINSLNNLTGSEGTGILVDENGRIIYHPDPALLMTEFPIMTAGEPVFTTNTASDGTRQLVYARLAQDNPWEIVLLIPASQAQQIALNIASPLLAIILILTVVGILVLRLGLSVVTRSLQSLSTEAGRIAQGQLDHSLPIDGDDEVGHLRRSFEQMRISLKARLDELNRLLIVSQGVASSLDIEEAVQPVLSSALAGGANAARIVLTPMVVPELDIDNPQPVSFGMGAAKEKYEYLDEQILNLARQQERMVLTNATRPRKLDFSGNAYRPASLLAIALRHENTFYGALWVAYEQTHSFSEEELRFLTTLASQAAIAAANAQLFLNAEIGRQRLAAILASTPDPVLVTDQKNQLLLANPAAWQVLGLGVENIEGQAVDKVIHQPELVKLLQSSAMEKVSDEVTQPGGRTFLAIASPVMAEGQRVGRVCVLRDVTHFKELDALKSEFVSTVSHDLRSPLTLMRGYATMLDMVGELNEQQKSYIRKIISGVESMSRLVNNLLDLGRIDAGIGLQLELVPVHDIVDRVVGGLQLQANQKKIQIQVEQLQQTFPLIEADQALLQQALHNLVENAIKYNRPEGEVIVRMRARGERMVFEVSDTGIGVSPMDQPRLFEKFYRGAQQGSKEQRGTGLGLAIVKSIAERHGGQVWVESQLGKGSTFYLAIPLRQPLGQTHLNSPSVRNRTGP